MQKRTPTKDVSRIWCFIFHDKFCCKFTFHQYSSNRNVNLQVQNLLQKLNTSVHKFKGLFYDLLTITMFESFSGFNGKFYEQCDDVAMGSPSDPTLVNVFMCRFESTCLVNCLSYFKLIVYRQFIDDTFLLFRSKDHAKKSKDSIINVS